MPKLDMAYKYALIENRRMRNFHKVWDRLKLVCQRTYDKDLPKFLGVPRSEVNTARKNEALPGHWLDILEEKNINSRYVLYGELPMVWGMPITEFFIEFALLQDDLSDFFNSITSEELSVNFDVVWDRIYKLCNGDMSKCLEIGEPAVQRALKERAVRPIWLRILLGKYGINPKYIMHGEFPIRFSKDIHQILSASHTFPGYRSVAGRR
jgi:hypothetical protein